MKTTTEYAVKRAYDPESTDDGFRVYVDRLWPRGLSHATFKYDLWEKQVSPSTELREWFHADPDGRWPEFCRRYADELRANPDFRQLQQTLATHPTVTLLYSSRDREHNNAIVLEHLLENG